MTVSATAGLADGPTSVSANQTPGGFLVNKNTIFSPFAQ